MPERNIYKLELISAFNHPAPTPNSRDYMGLAFTECDATIMDSVTPMVPGLLRCPAFVEQGDRQLRASGKYTRAELARFVLVGNARREIAAERLLERQMRARSLIALTALQECGAFARQQADFLQGMAQAGYEIGFMPEVPKDPFGTGEYSSLVLWSADGCGTYTQFPAQADGSHEAWYPQDAERAERHLGVHDQLWQRALPVEAGLEYLRSL